MCKVRDLPKTTAWYTAASAEVPTLDVRRVLGTANELGVGKKVWLLLEFR
jgi:hypothetical protein